MTRGRQVLAGYVTVAGAVTVASAIFPAGIRSAVNLAVGVLAIVCVLASLWGNHLPHQRPWRLALAGLGFLVVANALWVVTFATGDYVQLDSGEVYARDSAFTVGFQFVGYVLLLASGASIVMHHVSQDTGGIIDAAVLGIGIAAPIWEFLMRPRLLAIEAPLSAHAGALLPLLVMLGTLASLLRVVQTGDRRIRSLGYLLAAVLWTLVAVVVSAMFLDPRGKQIMPGLDLCWGMAFASIGAGVIDPSVAYLTRPAERHRAELTRRRLAYLGAPLILIPVIGCVPWLVGRQADVILLGIAPLVTAPLVLVRIERLLAQHGRNECRLAYQASHDDLTGLANRRHLFAEAEQIGERFRTGDPQCVAALYCDLDGFKPINDRLGHDAGDDLLRVVSLRLKGCLRSDDLLSRIGGDEFLAICPDVGTADAELLRDRMRSAVSDPIPLRGRQIRLGVTIGVAVATCPEGFSVDALVVAADTDMYARKPAAVRARSLGAEPR